MKKVAYDISLMRPACVLLATVLGGDKECANAFNSADWLVETMPGMKVYPVSDEQLRLLVDKTEAARKVKR